MGQDAPHAGAPDFPFYRGVPVVLGGRQWLVVMAALALACWLLVSPWTRPSMPGGLLLPGVLFCSVPLAALALVAGRAWTALFARVSGRDAALMLGIAVLNLAVTLLVGWTLADRLHSAANPLFATLSSADGATRSILFLAMVPQLLGEELFTVLPFLACLWLLHARCGLGRGRAVLLAWLVSAIPFCLIHLPTYDWNLAQCLIVIGSARLVLSVAYLVSRNVWVSTGAHVINDWALFGSGLAASAAAH